MSFDVQTYHGALPYAERGASVSDGVCVDGYVDDCTERNVSNCTPDKFDFSGRVSSRRRAYLACLAVHEKLPSSLQLIASLLAASLFHLCKAL